LLAQQEQERAEVVERERQDAERERERQDAERERLVRDSEGKEQERTEESASERGPPCDAGYMRQPQAEGGLPPAARSTTYRIGQVGREPLFTSARAHRAVPGGGARTKAGSEDQAGPGWEWEEGDHMPEDWLAGAGSPTGGAGGWTSEVLGAGPGSLEGDAQAARARAAREAAAKAHQAETKALRDARLLRLARSGIGGMPVAAIRAELDE
jgi:hypothetical protein